MALFRPRLLDPPPRAITAATANVPLGDGGAWSTWKYGNRDWQIEAWRLYDIIGELRFLAGWIGDSVSQARLYVATIGETGEEEGEVEDDQIARLAAVPLGSGSQRDDNLRLLGIDLAVPGEAWIVGEGALTDDPTGWFVLTAGQIKRGDRGVINVQRPMIYGGGVLTLTDGADVLTRVWRPHPNDITQSDSPVRSAIPALREIELLTKREFAELESRLTGAGLMPFPEGLTFPSGDGDPEGMAGFMALLQRAASINIQDQSNASAKVPIMFTVPDQMMEHIDKMRPITFWSELSDQIIPLKDRAISRVGASFEIPAELLTGLGDSNHWTAWAVGEEGIKRIKPYLATIADGLTRGFLIPSLTRAGIANPERYAYAFDVAPLSVRPNRLPEALDLWDRFLITDQAAVTSGAFDKKQMPDDPERLKMLLFRAVAADPTLLLDPGVRAALGVSGEPVAITGPAPAAVPAEEEAPVDGPPATDTDGPTDGATPAGAASVGRLMLGQSRLLVLRALELAGGRLASPADRRGRWATIPRHELHTQVGCVDRGKVDQLLVGAWTHVPAVAEDIDVGAAVLEQALHGYCRELLARGMPHDDDLLIPVLRAVVA